MPLALMALVGTLGFNFQVVLPLLAKFSFDGGAADLCRPGLGDGARLDRRRPCRPAPRAGRARPVDRRRARLRRLGAARGGDPTLALEAIACPARRRRRHLRRDQLVPPARRRSGDAGPGDGPLLGRLPRLDPTRGPDRRVAQRGDRSRAALVLAGAAGVVAAISARLAFESAGWSRRSRVAGVAGTPPACDRVPDPASGSA